MNDPRPRAGVHPPSPWHGSQGLPPPQHRVRIIQVLESSQGTIHSQANFPDFEDFGSGGAHAHRSLGNHRKSIEKQIKTHTDTTGGGGRKTKIH